MQLAAEGVVHADEVEDGKTMTTMMTGDDTGSGQRAIESGRMMKSKVTARKRELREKVNQLKSTRAKIPKSNFARREERKAIGEEIKALERERAELMRTMGGSGDGVGGEEEEEAEDMAM